MEGREGEREEGREEDGGKMGGRLEGCNSLHHICSKPRADGAHQQTQRLDTEL